MIRRGGEAGAAYLATSLVTLATLYALNRAGDAELLRQVLAIQFIASLAAGLEPGTAKAAALGGASRGEAPPSTRAIVVVSGLKALLAAPILALVWRLFDPTMDARLLVFTPFICAAGFAATDLRVIYDLRGRHTAAIWIKQGSLGGGLIVLATLAAAGIPLAVAVGVSTLARLLLILVLLGGAPGGSRVDRSGLTALLRDPRWLSLAGASAIAAIGGSADRMFGLRYLSAESWAGYFALYEVFSKFWFLPYFVAPIVFARTAAGRDTRNVTRWAAILTSASGLVFVAVVAAALFVAPDLPRVLLGSRLSAAVPSFAIVAFAAGVALNSLAQIRIAELQGRGAAHRTLVIMALSALATTALFYLAARTFGAPGLLCAWLIKSLVEVALAYAPFRRRSQVAT